MQTARITIEVTEPQRQQLRVLAALSDMTIKDLILDRTIGLEPNAETVKSFSDYKKNKGLTKHKDLEKFWKDINS